MEILATGYSFYFVDEINLLNSTFSRPKLISKPTGDLVLISLMLNLIQSPIMVFQKH